MGWLTLGAGEVLPGNGIHHPPPSFLQGPVGPAGGPGFPGAPGAKVRALPLFPCSCRLPLGGPPALLRGVSQLHPPLLSMEAGKGQAFHSPPWHDTELGVQLQLEIGGRQKTMGRHGRSGREQKTRTQKGEGKAQQTLEPGGSWRTWARRWLRASPSPASVWGSGGSLGFIGASGRPASPGKAPVAQAGCRHSRSLGVLSGDRGRAPMCSLASGCLPSPAFPRQPDSV